MSLAYQVTKRGAAGEPTEISCTVHPSCGWRLAATGPRRDDDAIFQAMAEAHVRDRVEPDRPAAGHLRRRR